MKLKSRFVLECENYGEVTQFKEGDKVKIITYKDDEEIIGRIADIDVEWLVLNTSKEFESSFKKSLDYLIIGGDISKSSKKDKALKDNVKLFTEEELMKLI